MFVQVPALTLLGRGNALGILEGYGPIDADTARRIAGTATRWLRILTDPETGTNVDGVYWKYETFLKKCESKLGALLGSNGGIYAIRKRAYTAIPTTTRIVDPSMKVN